jgi:hypothetical protein
MSCFLTLIRTSAATTPKSSRCSGYQKALVGTVRLHGVDGLRPGG